MFRSRSVLVSLVLLSWLVPQMAGAQAPIQLKSVAAGGLIAANGDSVTLNGTGGMASVTVQTLDTYSGTMELQCATDAAGTAFDTDDEVMLSLMGSTTTSTDITDTVGIYQGNISGCTAVKLIATAGFAASDVTVRVVAITPGGGSSGGGAAGAVSITQGGNTAAVNASSQLSVTCANCSGSGVSVLEDAASANGDAGTPAYTVRNNTLTAATGADGDYQPQKSTAAGAQYIAPTFADVVASTGAGASGAQTQRVITATDSTIGTVTAVTTVSTVTNVATIGTSVTPGTAAANLGKAEDAVAGSGDTGTMALAVRTDAAAPTAAAGDYTPLLTDAIGRLWTSGAFAEDAAHVSADIGVMALGVRTDTAASLSGTTGDYNPFITDALGKLWTTGTYNEDLAHTSTDTGTFVFALRRDTTPSSSSGTAGDYSSFNVDANGRLYTNTTLYNSAGTELTPATDKAEDAAHASGDTGPVIMAKRTDVAAVSSGTTEDYSTVNVDALGLVWARHLDPCSGVAKTFIAINISTATTTEITPSLAGASTNYYVCAINLVTAAANNVALTDDDSDGCGSVTSGLAGGTTAASGWNFAANGGLTFGNGDSSVFKTAGTNRVICLVTSATTQLSGSIAVVAAP